LISLIPATIKNLYNEDTTLRNFPFPIAHIADSTWQLKGEIEQQILTEWWNKIDYIETLNGNWFHKFTLIM